MRPGRRLARSIRGETTFAAGPAREVHKKAVNEAIKSLARDKAATSAWPSKPVAKNVKVDLRDVALFVRSPTPPLSPSSSIC